MSGSKSYPVGRYPTSILYDSGLSSFGDWSDTSSMGSEEDEEAECTANVCLSAHNRESSRLGITPLQRSTSLEKSALRWANTIKNGDPRHSANEFPGTGENLYRTSARLSETTYEVMIAAWVDQKRYFRNKPFPNVSSTGDWKDVGHYTAIIWSDTRRVGCAAVEGSHGTTLVAHCAEPGNVYGEWTY